MQAGELQARSPLTVTYHTSAFGEQVRRAEAMRRCARLLREEIARGRLSADLAVPFGQGTIVIAVLVAILDTPHALAPKDVGAYEQLARDLTRALAYVTVDHELAERFAALSGQQRALLNFRNRPGIAPLTYLECGRQIGLSDEGARMLYHRTCRQLAGDSALRLLPRIRSAIRAMAILAAGGGGLSALHDDLRTRGLLHGAGNFDDLIVFWRATELECPYPAANLIPRPKPPTSHVSGAARSVARKPVARASRAGMLPAELRQKARQLSQNCGAFSLAWLGADIPAPALRAMLKRHGYTLLVPGWYWREHARVNGVATVTRKVCAVTARVSPHDLRSALARHLSDRGFAAPPTPVVTAIALRSGLVTRRGRALVPAEAFVPDVELNGVEYEVYRLIVEGGPVLSQQTLFEAICGRGRAPQTLTTVLQRSPIIQRVASGRYALIGSEITDVDIAAARVAAFDAAGALTYNTDGTVTYRVNAGPELLYRGILNTGSLAAFAGEWQTPAGTRLMVDSRRIQGLKAIVRTLALEKGERIAVRFDTWTQTVTVARVADDG